MDKELLKAGLVWNDSYNLNVHSIDEAHKEIFQITALLLEENLAGNRDAVAQSVEFLKKYVIRHFEDEEKYMLEINYPGYAGHKARHAAFRDEVVPAIEARLIESDYDGESVDEFIGILIDWLSEHIMTQDKIINIDRRL